MKRYLSVAAVAALVLTVQPVRAAAEEPLVQEAGTATHDRTITDSRVRESSGLALSAFDSSLLWTHNDSGGAKQIFAITQSGAIKAAVTVGGAAMRDWEDIAAGPGNSLWVGDIGDNAAGRSSVQVYKLAEPRNPTASTVPATRYEFAYPEGPSNAETLMIHPTTGRLYLVSKNTSGGNGAIYQAPTTLSSSSVNKLTKVASAPGRITAGAWAPDGESFMIRTQTRGYLYDSSFTSPRVIQLPKMVQGESLTFGSTTSHVYLGSEGANSPVFRMATGLSGDTTPSAPVPTPTPTPAIPALGWSPTEPIEPNAGVVRPESFGAQGDGVSDDSTALQSAVDAAGAAGKKVELSAKTYLMQHALMLPSKSHLYGVGSQSVLKFTWAYNDAAHDGLYIGNKGQGSTGNTDLTLDNFAIRGAGSGNPEGLNATHESPRVPGVRFRLVDRFKITGVEVSYVPGISVLNQGSKNGLIKDNYVHHSGRDGINTGWYLNGAERVLVIDNTIEKIGDDGVALLGANGSHFGEDQWSHDLAAIDNVINGWTTNIGGKALGRGIAVISVKNSHVLRNRVNFTESDGILVAPAVDPVTDIIYRSSNVHFEDNFVTNAGQLGGGYGVEVKRADAITFIRTTISNSKLGNWNIHDCVRCTTG